MESRSDSLPHTVERSADLQTWRPVVIHPSSSEQKHSTDYASQNSPAILWNSPSTPKLSRQAVLAATVRPPGVRWRNRKKAITMLPVDRNGTFGFVADGELRLYDAIREQVESEFQQELADSDRYWDVREKIREEINNRMAQIASPQSLW